MAYLKENQLREIGFRRIGTNVRISDKASIYNAELIEIGDNTRIDDFSIISGKITIGRYVHIAASAALFAGDAGIVMEDYTGLSGGARVYAVTEDLHSGFPTNPTIPIHYRRVIEKRVILEKHVVVGASSTVLPGCIIRTGSVIGANSLVINSTKPWFIYSGVPAKALFPRNMIEDSILKNLK